MTDIHRPAERDPLDLDRARALLAADSPFRLRQVITTASTNADLAAAAGSLAHASVLTSEEQVAGRGRLGRTWVCPPGAGLMFSVLLRLPEVPQARLGWTGIALGTAIVRAVRPLVPGRCGLKWPNDVMIGPAKVAGILAEVAGDAVIVGAGINVSLRAGELPRADATSLTLAGAGPVDRAALLAAILDAFDGVLRPWTAAGGDVDASGLRNGYRDICTTLGRTVRLELPGGGSVTGIAHDIDVSGALVLRTPAGSRAYAAGDVVHLRAAADLT